MKKCIKTLLTQHLIKEVKSVASKFKKIYMLFNLGECTRVIMFALCGPRSSRASRSFPCFSSPRFHRVRGTLVG
jgi:hypothetical protein